MLLGSFNKIFETKRLANTHDNEIIFTTSLEGGIGRRITAILASGLGSLKNAHGLATGHLLTADIINRESLSNGIYKLDDHLDKLSVNLQKLKEVSTYIS
jgi:hypothetical protein